MYIYIYINTYIIICIPCIHIFLTDKCICYIPEVAPQPLYWHLAQEPPTPFGRFEATRRWVVLSMLRPGPPGGGVRKLGLENKLGSNHCAPAMWRDGGEKGRVHWWFSREVGKQNLTFGFMARKLGYVFVYIESIHIYIYIDVYTYVSSIKFQSLPNIALCPSCKWTSQAVAIQADHPTKPWRCPLSSWLFDGQSKVVYWWHWLTIWYALYDQILA